MNSPMPEAAVIPTPDTFLPLWTLAGKSQKSSIISKVWKKEQVCGHFFVFVQLIHGLTHVDISCTTTARLFIFPLLDHKSNRQPRDCCVRAFFSCCVSNIARVGFGGSLEKKCSPNLLYHTCHERHIELSVCDLPLHLPTVFRSGSAP